MPALYVNCRRCHRESRTGIFVAADRLDGISLHGVLHHCTHCGRPDWYFTRDHHLLPPDGTHRSGRVVADARIGPRSSAADGDDRVGANPPDYPRPLSTWRPPLKERL